VDLQRFTRTEVSPGVAVVAFVSVFIHDNGLLDSARVEFQLSGNSRRLGPALRGNILQDHVVDPIFRVVIETQAAIVDPAQVMIGIDGNEQFAKSLPILLNREHIEFVRQRPPHIAKCPKPRHDVAKIHFVMPRIHCRESPLVIGVEEDDVSLNPQLLQILQPGFVMREELGVESIEIETPVTLPDIREARRLDAVERHPLGKDQEANPVEWTPRKGGQCFSLKVGIAVQPVIKGRAEREKRRAIRICKVIRVLDPDRPVILQARRINENAPGFTVELRIVRCR
jgi:hypothetical protein